MTDMRPCPYCGATPELVSGGEVYPHRLDLAGKSFWLCRPCGAYVGCHPGTTQPLGRLANSELRSAKVRAHAAFDPLWRSRRMTRSGAYAWLASKLRMVECHIGELDVDDCKRVVAMCAAARDGESEKGAGG